MANLYSFRGIVKGIREATDYKGNPKPGVQVIDLTTDSGPVAQETVGSFADLARYHEQEVEISGLITIGYMEREKKHYKRFEVGTAKPTTTPKVLK
ncbi:MAG: hypothetical protein M0Z50_15520 [Planctomycetia bacterium]|nr:hypothetical protein [Planctomycetia bacterium]